MTGLRAAVAIVALIFLGAACGPNTSRMTPRDTSPAASGTASSPADWPDVSARTQLDNTGARDVALIVAIEDYTFLPDVPGAVANAEAWRAFLEGSVGVDTVFTLYDRKASREEMTRFAQRAAAAVKPGGRIWFVFVGHGAPSAGGEGLLVGMDAQQTVDSLAARSAAQSDVVGILQKSVASEVVAVVDACFSGRDSGGELLARGSQPVVPVSAASVPDNVVVLSAAGADEFAGALPDVDRPAFSYLLLGAMRGWADNGDGSVTATEAVTWTRAQLSHVSGRTQTTRTAGNAAIRLTTGAREGDPGIDALMRGVRPAAVAESAPKRIPGHDTGKGLAVPIPAGWTVHSSVPPSFLEPEGPTEVLKLVHDADGAELMLSYMPQGANYFVQNITTMRQALENEGAVMQQQLAVEVEGREGLLQKYRFQHENGTRVFVIFEAVANGDQLWMWTGSVRAEHEATLTDAAAFIRDHSEFD
jgi:hypothetical protein